MNSGPSTDAALRQRRANVAAIATRKRAATHCKRGHSDWVWVQGRRRCRVCALDRAAAYRLHWMTPAPLDGPKDREVQPLRGAAGVRHPD